MKRAAAIVGQTPSFIRWAIRHECPFRQNDDSNLPYQTFRQLRSLRELSVGRIEGRIVDGICIHDDSNISVETIRGFPVEEILSFFGQPDAIQNTCGNCPANTVKLRTIDSATKYKFEQQVWAGCYGWVRSENSNFNLISEFESAVERNHFERSKFGHNTLQPKRIWYAIWQTTKWRADELSQLKRFMELLPESLISNHGDFADLVQAVNSCHKNGLVLETELIPKGMSDGIEWRIEPHCSNCRCEIKLNERKCGECQHSGHPVGSRTRKVLGLRPYMLLQEILGLQETTELINAYRDRHNSL